MTRDESILNFLKNVCYQILTCRGIEEKIRLALYLDGFSPHYNLSNHADIQIPIDNLSFGLSSKRLPSRPADWVQVEKMERKTIPQMLEANLVDVEINAMEVSAALMLEAENMPMEFYYDFTSHLVDEARHGQIMLDFLVQFPEHEISKTYSHRVWNMASNGKNFVEKIMIEYVIEEGWAADSTIDLIKQLHQNNHEDLAQVYYQLNQDEIRHASMGNKWVKFLLGQDEEAYMKLYEKLALEFHPQAVEIRHVPVRLASGFTKSFIRKFFK